MKKQTDYNFISLRIVLRRGHTVSNSVVLSAEAQLVLKSRRSFAAKSKIFEIRGVEKKTV